MKISFLLRPHLILASCATLAVLNGCAAVDQKIGLNYARQDDSLVRYSGDITVTRAAFLPASRNSRGEWVIGSLNNVYGVHQADLLSDRSPEEWITDALLYELRRAGFTVNYAESFPSALGRGIAITNINAFLTVNKGTVSTETRQELKFNLEIFLNGDKLKTLTVASRDNRTIPFDASKEEKEKIMLQSLQNAMQRIIPETVMLIDKK
jgi:hypothetical protein